MRQGMRESGRTARRARAGSAKDAIALLKADHRQVEAWFGQCKKSKSAGRKKSLAEKICKALEVHMRIEEEIFYPAFLGATQDLDMHHEAEVEHAGAKRLVAELEALSPENEYFDAKVKVLSEMIKHHVKEEEKPGGMFAEARKSHLDLDDLGHRLAQRKKELESSGNGGPAGMPRSLLDA